MGRLRFKNMQQEVYRLRNEHEEAICTATKCLEDLAKCLEDLKEAGKMVKLCEGSIHDADKERKHAQFERTQAKMAKAQEAMRDHERALVATIRERNSLKDHVAGIGALVA